MYKDLGISNAQLALFTSLLALPWALKPLWSPFVDVFKTKRWWTYMMQGSLELALSVRRLPCRPPTFLSILDFFVHNRLCLLHT